MLIFSCVSKKACILTQKMLRCYRKEVFYIFDGGGCMRVGLAQSEADTTVSSLAKWAEWLVSVITALRNFLVSIGIMDEESEEEPVA